MNLFVISDTHGTIERALEMFRRVTDSGTRIDGVLHAGDLLRDADAFAKEVRLPLWNVPGNCDGCFERNYQILDLLSGRLLLTHGHMEQADLSHQNLYYLAEEQACSAVCFGHTHVAEIRNIGGIDFVNPGSLTRPRDGSGGTCALIHSEESKFSAEILYYSRKDKKKTPHDKPRGGYLRRIMNYSDGQ